MCAPSSVCRSFLLFFLLFIIFMFSITTKVKNAVGQYITTPHRLHIYICYCDWMLCNTRHEMRPDLTWYDVIRCSTMRMLYQRDWIIHMYALQPTPFKKCALNSIKASSLLLLSSCYYCRAELTGKYNQSSWLCNFANDFAYADVEEKKNIFPVVQTEWRQGFEFIT